MNTFTRNLLIGAAAGLAATWIKSRTEPSLQEVGEKIYPPKPGELELIGADITRKPENTPYALVAGDFYEDLTGEPLSRDAKIRTMKCIRYAMGTGVGITYVSLVNPIKFLRIGNGATAGALVWAISKGSVLPKLGLQPKANQMPKSWWVWEIGSHLAFGIMMEQSRRLLTAVFKKRKRS